MIHDSQASKSTQTTDDEEEAMASMIHWGDHLLIYAKRGSVVPGWVLSRLRDAMDAYDEARREG